ncbi:hypothetical protein [Streptomyces californicus]|uniref:hypothetical protein n=1 Tax=Streptomyces californicus TaxID=67351 RepID=UPI0037B70FCF
MDDSKRPQAARRIGDLVKPRLLGAVGWPLLVVCAGVARVWTALGSTGRRSARRLAAAVPARRAARDAETRLRAIVATYAASTPLEPRLLVIEDRYTPGVAESGLFTLHRADCRVSCRMLVTAYFTSPLPPAETLSQIAEAGERALSGIPFTRALAAPARSNGPGELSHAGHTLTWDRPAAPLPEPAESPYDHRLRLLCEPSPEERVEDVRRRYGTVFALTLSPVIYYRMPR